MIGVEQRRPDFEKVAFEQRPEGGKGVSHMDTSGKNVWGRGNSQCKGPGAGACLICWRNSLEASVAAAG